MSIQLINFVFLVATINGVYSNVKIDLEKLPSTLSSAPKHDYPITQAILEYRIGVVSDLENASRVPGSNDAWYTYFKKGYLTYNPNNLEVSVRWDSGEEKGDMYYSENSNEKGRGFELSEMVNFDGNLIVADDQTGTLYAYEQGEFKPWKVVPIAGENNVPGQAGALKGEAVKISGHHDGAPEQIAMAIEWATVKGDDLYVGPNGKDGPNYVAKISKEGKMEFANWSTNFNNLKATLGIPDSGLMVIEACVYSTKLEKFYVVPKWASKNPKPVETDTRWILSLDIPNFTQEGKVGKPIAINEIEKHVDRGISSFRFIPHTNDHIIVALETSELYNASYITAFTTDGKMILNSTKVADVKFEGLDFL